jgi:hypothetical protein
MFQSEHQVQPPNRPSFNYQKWHQVQPPNRPSFDYQKWSSVNLWFIPKNKYIFQHLYQGCEDRPQTQKQQVDKKKKENNIDEKWSQEIPQTQV